MIVVLMRGTHETHHHITHIQGKSIRENIMSSILSDSALLRFAESAMPTCENSLSTAADDAGQPRYCRPHHQVGRQAEHQRRPLVGGRHGPIRHLCARHHRDLGNGEGADRLGGVREGAPHRRQHHPKWTHEGLKAIGLTAEGLMEPNTQ